MFGLFVVVAAEVLYHGYTHKPDAEKLAGLHKIDGEIERVKRQIGENERTVRGMWVNSTRGIFRSCVSFQRSDAGSPTRVCGATLTRPCFGRLGFEIRLARIWVMMPPDLGVAAGRRFGPIRLSIVI